LDYLATHTNVSPIRR